MTVLSGHLIRLKNIISPHLSRTHQNGLTFGEGPCGYDVRVEFDQYGSLQEKLIPKNGGFLLASTVEYFQMPTDLVGIVHDKSTWARRGLAVQNTVIEPGWQGYLTLELTNHGEDDIILHIKDPIAQILFHKVEGQPLAYAGKYHYQQRGPQQAR